jgi:choline dehydrogenase-like flavoprotein
MATPVLLLRSGGLANESGQVGRNLQMHPGSVVAGRYPDFVDPLFGGTQSYQSLQFLKEGFKLETMWSPPASLAVRTPGLGDELVDRLSDFNRTVVWDGIAGANRSLGRVSARFNSMDPVIRWRLHPEDAGILVRAIHELCRIHFAAGADRVFPGIAGLPEQFDSVEEADILRDASVAPGDLTVASSHLFCTTRMHGDPNQGVVDEWGKCYGLDNLYIADTGIFPACPSVNPMFTALALAHRQAQALKDRV